MPNMFAPKAAQAMIKDRAERLRMKYDTSAEGQTVADIKEWYGLLDLLDDDATQEFMELYSNTEDLPDVISGVEHTGEE